MHPIFAAKKCDPEGAYVRRYGIECRLCLCAQVCIECRLCLCTLCAQQVLPLTHMALLSLTRMALLSLTHMALLSPFFRSFNRWLPELAGLPSEFIHMPWEAPLTVLVAAKVRIGKPFPKTHAQKQQKTDGKLPPFLSHKPLHPRAPHTFSHAHIFSNMQVSRCTLAGSLSTCNPPVWRPSVLSSR
jgi:hypothetical protein